MSYKKYAYKGYTPEHYHSKLLDTDLASWAVGDYFKKRDSGEKGSAKCAMGQLGVRYSMNPEHYPEEAKGMLEMFRHYLDVEVHHVNDGLDTAYAFAQNDTAFINPKQRILSAIRVCEDVYNIEQMLLEDRRKVRILLSYLHRNPANFDLGDYTITKSNTSSTNLLYE